MNRRVPISHPIQSGRDFSFYCHVQFATSEQPNPIGITLFSVISRSPPLNGRALGPVTPNWLCSVHKDLFVVMSNSPPLNSKGSEFGDF